jgi:hypothetical protein
MIVYSIVEYALQPQYIFFQDCPISVAGKIVNARRPEKGTALILCSMSLVSTFEVSLGVEGPYILKMLLPMIQDNHHHGSTCGNADDIDNENHLDNADEINDEDVVGS